jgi:tetratricopeptide (TPR) repeat protein
MGMKAAELALLGLVCALFAGVASEPPSPAAPAVSAETEQADRALREEQLQAAKKLNADLPRNRDAIYAAGFVSNEQGDSAIAIRHWEEALQLDPSGVRVFNRAEACYNLGYLYLLKEDYEKAVPFLRESVKLNPRRQEASYRLAYAYFLKGEAEECLRVLEEGAVETPLAYRLRGQAAQQTGNLEQARKYYERAIALNPDLAEAYYGLATTCARLGDEAKSGEYRDKFNALKSAGQAEGRQARTDFNPLAITRRSLAQTHTEIARVYLAYSQSQPAERLLLRAAELDAQNTACRFQLLMLCQQTQRNTEALRFALEMVKAEPRNAFHYLAAGNLHLRLQQRAEAEAAFKQVVELAPGRAEGYFALAQFYLQGKTQAPEALRLASHAVALAPSAVNYYVLSQASAANGDVAGAAAAIQKACEMDPNNSNYRELRATLGREK